LDEFASAEPSTANALKGTSRQFFEPPCPNTYLEPGPKPGENTTLQFLPNQPVSRAWDLVFRVVLGKTVNHEFGIWRNLRNAETPQSPPGLPAHLIVELQAPFSDDELKRFAGLVGNAAAAANAVIPQAAEDCRREHEKLASNLGLSRPRVGLSTIV
jgi:hypothetical protein